MTIDETAKSLFLMKYAKEEIRKGVAIPVAKPVVTVGSYTYDGTPQGPTVTGLDEDHCEVLYGTNTDAGTYTMEIHLINNEQYMWADDNSNRPLYYEYTIDKADQVLTVPSQSITLDTNTPNATFAVSGVQGTLHATGSDATVITVSNLGSNVTIAGNKSKSGTATVDIWAEATSNYNESAHLTINVTTQMLKIVTWASGAKNELEDMVNADAAGNIDLLDYWSNGDSRSVTLPAISAIQYTVNNRAEVTLPFILDANNSFNLVSALPSGRSKSKFLIIPRNNYASLPVIKSEYPHRSDQNVKGYPYTNLHGYINGTYKNTLTNLIGNIIHQFVNQLSYLTTEPTKSNPTGAIGAGNFNEYVSLPTVRNVLGDNPTVINSFDGWKVETIPQFNWYKTAANREPVSGGALVFGSTISAYWQNSYNKYDAYAGYLGYISTRRYDVSYGNGWNLNSSSGVGNFYPFSVI